MALLIKKHAYENVGLLCCSAVIKLITTIKHNLSDWLLTSNSPMWPPGNHWGGSRGLFAAGAALLRSWLVDRRRSLTSPVNCQLPIGGGQGLGPPSTRWRARPAEAKLVDGCDWLEAVGEVCFYWAMLGSFEKSMGEKTCDPFGTGTNNDNKIDFFPSHHTIFARTIM